MDYKKLADSLEQVLKYVRGEENTLKVSLITPDAGAREQTLANAAEQFLASCKDGDVKELIDYYEDIFTEALKLPPAEK